MFYTIYKITNKINGKIYIGKHKTKNLDDGYMGSGIYLKRAIKKHGIENFAKEILFVLDTEEEMNSLEKELVTFEFCESKGNYNICVGGQGGFSYINKNADLILKRTSTMIKNEVWRQKAIRNNNQNLLNPASMTKSKETRKRLYPNNTASFTGKKHTEKTKRIIGEKNSLNQKGTSNSQHGTFWITNGNENIKLKIGSIIPDGWRKGRIMKTKMENDM